jgi:hypothetical protein
MGAYGCVGRVLRREIDSFRLARSNRTEWDLLMNEIIFEVHEDEMDGGYVATVIGHAIATQAETINKLREMVGDAVRCHFGDGLSGEMPSLIRLHFVREEVLAA